jgi:hypothetical protein
MFTGKNLTSFRGELKKEEEEEYHAREDKRGCGGLCKIKSFFLANLKLISR